MTESPCECAIVQHCEAWRSLDLERHLLMSTQNPATSPATHLTSWTPHILTIADTALAQARSAKPRLEAHSHSISDAKRTVSMKPEDMGLDRGPGPSEEKKQHTTRCRERLALASRGCMLYAGFELRFEYV